MATPHCPVCGRWDGTHSGGCPQTGQPYPGAPAPKPPTVSPWVVLAGQGKLPAKVLA